jgi:hypothetical protein
MCSLHAAATLTERLVLSCASVGRGFQVLRKGVGSVDVRLGVAGLCWCWK